MTFDILNPDTTINSHLLIEASAGTGKTYTIEHLFVRRFLESGSGVDRFFIKNFAVITFTRACAKELVIRIRACCDQALNMLQHPYQFDSIPGYIQKIIAGGPEAIRANKQKIMEAKAQLDSALISTIHGFCLRVLEDYSQQQESIEQYSWASAQEASSIIYDVINHDLTDEVITSKQLFLLLKSYQNDMRLLITEIYKKLWDEEYLLEECSSNYGSYDSVLALLNQTIQKILKEGRITPEDVYEILENASCSFKGIQDRSGNTKEVYRAMFYAFHLLCNQGKCDKAIESYMNAPLIFGEVFKFLKAKADHGMNPALQFIELAKEHIDPLLKKLSEPKTILKTLITYIRPKVIKILRAQGFLTFDDVIEQVKELSQLPEFKEFLRNRFQVLIIDEFQDTDPHQWNILSSVFLKDSTFNGYVYLVGDPKQAIYAFRNADVYSYMNAKSEFADTKSCTLTKNYRSSPDVVKALNAIFIGPHSKHIFYLPRLQESLAVQEVTCSKTINDIDVQDGKKAIHFFIAKGALGKKRTWPTEEIEDAILFPYIAQEIHNLHIQGFSFDRFSILVKDKFQARRIEDFLTSNKIPAVSWRSDSVVKSSAFAFFKRLIKVIHNSRDIGSLTFLLSNEPFFFTESDCRQLQDDTEESLSLWGEFVEECRHLNDCFKYETLGKFFASILDVKFPLCNMTLQGCMLQKSCSKTLLRDFKQIIDICLSNEKRFSKNLEKLLFFLHDLEKEVEDNPDLFPTYFDPLEKRCGILTMHKSKGLEFDFVFALGASSRTKAVAEDESSPQDRTENIFEYDQEKSRQLYVACTRAKRRLYVPVVIDLDQKIPAAGTLSCVELLLSYIAKTSSDEGKNTPTEKLYEKIYSTFSSELLLEGLKYLVSATNAISISEEQGPYNIEGISEAIEPMTLQEICTPIQESYSVLSFTSMKRSRDYAEIELLDGVQVKDERSTIENDFPSGKEVGIILHSLIAECIKMPAIRSSEEQLRQFIDDGVYGTLLEPYADQVHNIISRVFSLVLSSQDPDMKLESIHLNHAFCEMEFIFHNEKSNLNQDFYRGTIDLVIQWKGKYYIIDWKSNDLGSAIENYSSDRLQSELYKNKYDVQAKMYAHALLRYLKCPSRGEEPMFGGVIFVFLRALLFDEVLENQNFGIVHLHHEDLTGKKIFV